MGRQVICYRCKEEKEHFSRHLCYPCYRIVYRLGPKVLESYPLMYAQRDDVLRVYEALKAEKLQREIAEAIGITPSALALHLDRGREAGDPRAEPPEVPVMAVRRQQRREQRRKDELSRSNRKS